MEEIGYEEAVFGIGLSFGLTTIYEKYDDLPDDIKKRLHEIALKLCEKDGGHNKFLESIDVWLDVKVPRYVWQEMDTYRLTTKQSASTMHTLIKELERYVIVAGQMSDTELMEEMYHNEMFEEGSLENTEVKGLIAYVHDELWRLKSMLPEGFLQRRIWKVSYMNLRNIIRQRRNHRLPHWKMFIEQVLERVTYPELLPGLE
jgi:hypothetical protein